MHKRTPRDLTTILAALTMCLLVGCGDSVEVRLQNASIAMSRDQSDEALRLAQDVLDEQPDHTGAMALTVQARMNLDRLEEARQTIAKEMELLGPMRLSEVEEIQLRIVQQVRQLEEEGQLTIVRGDADDSFV